MTLKERYSDIRRKIQRSTAKTLNQRVARAEKPIEKRVREEFLKAIKSQPEYSSLLNGDLRFEFGLTQPSEKLNNIFEVWVNSIKVTRHPIVFNNGRLIFILNIIIISI